MQLFLAILLYNSCLLTRKHLYKKVMPSKSESLNTRLHHLHYCQTTPASQLRSRDIETDLHAAPPFYAFTSHDLLHCYNGMKQS